MKTLKIALAAVLLLSLATLSTAQKKEKPHIPDGSKIYIAKMEGDLDGFISAEIAKRKLPITVVTDDTIADYIITGGTVKGDHHWYDTVVVGVEKDSNQGNIQVIDAKAKAVIWSAEAGDRSFWWGPLKKGGRRKVADRLVGKMNSELFKK